MVLVVKLNPGGLPLRHYVVPAIAFSLAAIRAMDADVEDVIIWRHHPDLAFVCIRGGGDCRQFLNPFSHEKRKRS